MVQNKYFLGVILEFNFNINLDYLSLIKLGTEFHKKLNRFFIFFKQN